MIFLRLAPVALWILGCPSCGTGASDPETSDGGRDANADGETGAPGLSVDEYCPRQAAVLCAGYEQCCNIADVSACVERVQAECEAGEISSIRSGEAYLDGVVAERCLDAYEESLSDCVYDDDIRAACRYQWYGDAQPGEACRDVWYCSPGLGCVLDGTEGVCVELPAETESCGEYGVCQAGLYCSFDDWLCHPRPGLTQPCEREGICSAGSCVESTCQAVPWC